MLTHTSVKASNYALIDTLPGREYYKSSTESEVRKMITKLRAFGLKDHELGLVIKRIVEEKTFKDIIKEDGWVSEATASYHYKMILKKLREGKYK